MIGRSLILVPLTLEQLQILIEAHRNDAARLRESSPPEARIHQNRANYLEDFIGDFKTDVHE